MYIPATKLKIQNLKSVMHAVHSKKLVSKTGSYEASEPLLDLKMVVLKHSRSSQHAPNTLW